jgi:hypothetical protein
LGTESAAGSGYASAACYHYGRPHWNERQDINAFAGRGLIGFRLGSDAPEIVADFVVAVIGTQ